MAGVGGELEEFQSACSELALPGLMRFQVLLSFIHH